MRDLKLDILDRADDDIIDRLVPFSSDDKKTKKRILAMSEKKLAELQRGSETAANEISVRGVEQYRRPMWYKPLSIAAALVFMAGGIGMFALLNRTKVNQFNDPDQNNVAATTEAVTTEVQTTEAPTEPDTLLSEEEMKATFDRLLPVLYESESYNFLSMDRTDLSGETVTLHSTHFNEDILYEKLGDDRFTSYNDLIEYYKPYFTDPTRYFYCYIVDGDDISVLANDENIHDVIELGGELYIHKNAKSLRSDHSDIEPVSEQAYYVSSDSFQWERVIPAQEDDAYGIGENNFTVLDVVFQKDDDGVWKIVSSLESTSQYSDDELNSGLPLTESLIRPSEMNGIDTETAYENAKEYAKSNYDYTGKFTWNNIDELYEDTEIITNDYVNNNNWMTCTCSDLLHDGGCLILFLDENGTVFAQKITH